MYPVLIRQDAVKTGRGRPQTGAIWTIHDFRKGCDWHKLICSMFVSEQWLSSPRNFIHPTKQSTGVPSVHRSERTATSAAEGRSLEVAWSILDDSWQKFYSNGQEWLHDSDSLWMAVLSSSFSSTLSPPPPPPPPPSSSSSLSYFCYGLFTVILASRKTTECIPHSSFAWCPTPATKERYRMLKEHLAAKVANLIEAANESVMYITLSFCWLSPFNHSLSEGAIFNPKDRYWEARPIRSVGFCQSFVGGSTIPKWGKLPIQPTISHNPSSFSTSLMSSCDQMQPDLPSLCMVLARLPSFACQWVVWVTRWLRFGMVWWLFQGP